MRIWRCPECGSGVRAPSKLRKLDVRRWCLECSSKSTVLIERFCVARESRKQSKQKRDTALRQQHKAKMQEELQMMPWILYPLFTLWQRLRCWEKPEQMAAWKLEIIFGDRPANCRILYAKKTIHLRASTDIGDTSAWLIWRMAQVDAFHAGGGHIHYYKGFGEAVNQITGFKPSTITDMKALWEEGKRSMGAFMSSQAKGFSSHKKLPAPKPRKRTKRAKGLKAATLTRQRKASW